MGRDKGREGAERGRESGLKEIFAYCTCFHSGIICNSRMVEWINKLLHGHAMEYYPALKKKKEIRTHATTWMNREGIMLNEMSVPEGQVQNGVTSMRSLE